MPDQFGSDLSFDRNTILDIPNQSAFAPQLLKANRLTCDGWLALSADKKRGLAAAFIAAVFPVLLGGTPEQLSTLPFTGGRRNPVPTAPSPRSVRVDLSGRAPLGTATYVVPDAQVNMLIAQTDSYCVRVRAGLTVRPAGQAASPPMSAASSYFNGPTLLAAAIAFAGGYAACHYLAPPEPARRLPRGR